MVAMLDCENESFIMRYALAFSWNTTTGELLRQNACRRIMGGRHKKVVSMRTLCRHCECNQVAYGGAWHRHWFGIVDAIKRHGHCMREHEQRSVDCT